MTADAVVADAVPVWHHPHFISKEQGDYSTRWRFRPFSGDEPEPKIPDGVEVAFRAARDAHPRGESATGRAVAAAWKAAHDECRAADTMWRTARHNRDVIALLKEIAPLVDAFRRAKQRAIDTYEELHGTPDGFWQAKLLALAEHRQVARDAARALDLRSGDLLGVTDGLPERVLEQIPSQRELEKAAGVDLGDWYPQNGYDYGDGPDASRLSKLFREQDERIAQVTRLFVGG